MASLVGIPITYVLIGITVLISVLCFNNGNLKNQLLHHPYSVAKNSEVWRLITSGFIHADWTHLIVNMITLYFFGRNAEYGFGHHFGEYGLVIFIVFYLVAIVVSDFPYFLKHKDNPNYASLGASGATCAVLFASILFFPSNTIYLYFAIPIPAPLFAVAFIAYSIYAGKKSRDRINHSAHLWGSIFGLVVPILLKPAIFIEFTKQIKNMLPF